MAHEAGVPPGWRERIRGARDDETVVTRSLSGRPARGLPNTLIDDMEQAGPMGWPQQNAATGPVRRAAATADEPELMSLWAGQAAALAGPDRPAAEIIDQVVAQARADMARLGRMATG